MEGFECGSHDIRYPLIVIMSLAPRVDMSTAGSCRWNTGREPVGYGAESGLRTGFVSPFAGTGGDCVRERRGSFRAEACGRDLLRHVGSGLLGRRGRQPPLGVRRVQEGV